MDLSWRDRDRWRPRRRSPRSYRPYTRRERSRSPRAHVRTAPDLYRPIPARRRSPAAPRQPSPDKHEEQSTLIYENLDPSSLTAPTWTKIPSENHDAALNALLKSCHSSTVLRKIGYRLLEFTMGEMEGTRLCANCRSKSSFHVHDLLCLSSLLIHGAK